MLSFELSAIDLILAIAVVILLILHITKPSTAPVAEEKSSVEGRFPPRKKATTITRARETEEETRSPAHPPKDSIRCPHHFGYLKKLDRNAPIPDECLSCPRIMEC